MHKGPIFPPPLPALLLGMCDTRVYRCGGQRWSFSVTPYFLRQRLSLNLELAEIGRLAVAFFQLCHGLPGCSAQTASSHHFHDKDGPTATHPCCNPTSLC